MITFVLSDMHTVRSVMEGPMGSFAVMHSIHSVSPASITEAELHALVGAYSHAEPDDNEVWTTTLPGLEGEVRTYSNEYPDRLSEVASRLNEWGVSISDWPTYTL